jgi:MutS domain V
MNLPELKLKEIEEQIKRFKERLIKLEKKSRKLGTIKGVILLSYIILFLVSYFYLSLHFVIAFAVMFLVTFGILTMFHNDIDKGIRKQKIWIDIKSTYLARIKIDWQNLPPRRVVKQNNPHPFETDLNISGEYSLHRLIDSSITPEGSLKLLEWLTNINPSFDNIIFRQNIVKELIPLTKFRGKLLLNSNMVTKKELYGKRLLDWFMKKSSIVYLKKILTALTYLIPLNIIFILLAIFDISYSLWPVTSLLIVFIYYISSKHINELLDKSLTLAEDMGKFYSILKFLEEYHYGKNQHLKNLCSSFTDNAKSPTSYFKKIDRLILLSGFQKNPLTRLLLNAFFPWDFYQAYKLEKIKSELSGQLPGWLETWYVLEALISLANYAYLNPGYTFPKIKKHLESNESILDAKSIAHPLIPFRNNITNDFRINNRGEIIIITGSNMSGKSTFLKTLGMNLVLAFSGSVVQAQSLSTGLFRVFTSINITDSVVDGISYFYAEVKRLKQLLLDLNEENSLPIFFLIDEIFKGTNNKERLTGSRSYIKALAGKNCTGIISTHDLELIRMENELPGVSNYHFKEEIINNKMLFKYKIIKGPSPTTNALEIMKLEGLPID